MTGWRPIHWLTSHGDLSLIRKLVTKGAAINLPTKEKGMFPIDIAGKLGYVDVV